MRALALLFGLFLTVEGTAKQIDPRGWMRWLVVNPVAYLPERMVVAAREFASLSTFALRLLGGMQLAAGLIILWLGWPRSKTY